VGGKVVVVDVKVTVIADHETVLICSALDGIGVLFDVEPCFAPLISEGLSFLCCKMDAVAFRRGFPMCRASRVSSSATGHDRFPRANLKAGRGPAQGESAAKRGST
jgi:hypothetical protein